MKWYFATHNDHFPVVMKGNIYEKKFGIFVGKFFCFVYGDGRLTYFGEQRR